MSVSAVLILGYVGPSAYHFIGRERATGCFLLTLLLIAPSSTRTKNQF
jgi:hypothetical protein